jgi:protein-S-isoprenylcysteine O-methyltransferase Ste14
MNQETHTGKSMALLTRIKGLTGVGLPLLFAGTLLEAMTIAARRWISLPFAFPPHFRLIFSIPCVLIVVLGIIWFNRTLNLVKIHFLEGENKLVTHGPFNYVRHPLYAALLLGLPPLLVIWYADLLFLVPWLLMFVLSHFIARIEERNLIASFGDAYRTYMQYVPALVPYKGAGGRRYREHCEGAAPGN